MARRNDIDWEVIEIDYQIGKLSFRDIAVKHGCAVSTVTLRAKRDGWTRNLSEAVRAGTKAALIAESAARAKQIGTAIGTQSAHATVDAFKLTISENVIVVTAHRSRTQRLASAFDSLMLSLEQQIADPIAMEMLIAIVAGNDPAAGRALSKMAALPAMVDTLKKATEINSRLQADERVSHNINDLPRGDDERTAMLRRIVAEEETASST